MSVCCPHSATVQVRSFDLDSSWLHPRKYVGYMFSSCLCVNIYPEIDLASSLPRLEFIKVVFVPRITIRYSNIQRCPFDYPYTLFSPNKKKKLRNRNINNSRKGIYNIKQQASMPTDYYHKIIWGSTGVEYKHFNQIINWPSVDVLQQTLWLVLFQRII